MRMYVGIDNGVSGSIGIIYQDEACRGVYYYPMPTFKEQDYTKSKKNITRIQWRRLRKLLKMAMKSLDTPAEQVQIMIERPMVNPSRFRATGSALRALEATLIVLNSLKLSWVFVDSREWQKELLPKDAKGADLKTASCSIGIRMFPSCEKTITKQKDADGLLIAEHCRRTFG